MLSNGSELAKNFGLSFTALVSSQLPREKVSQWRYSRLCDSSTSNRLSRHVTYISVNLFSSFHYV